MRVSVCVQKKDEADRDKTPVPEEKMSTRSRLESKYSDVLGRRRRREQQEHDDRDKTLEPDKMSFAPLARSATTILSSTSKKESTPYRLNRNYSDRKPTGLSSTTANAKSSYKPRTDFSLLQHSASSATAIPKFSNYESPIMRHKDTVYDIYGTRIPTTSRYDYDSGFSTNTGGSYGYYDGRDKDKENTFKSKYEPSRLYAELNNNEPFSRDRNMPRIQRGYRKTATTHLTNFDDDLDLPSTSSGYSERNMNSTSRYAPRKSLGGGGYQRSQTQKFFDSEKSSVLRSLTDSTNRNFDDEPLRSEAVKEREARRKEIQGLIAKYAQIDDVYLRAIDNDVSSSNDTRNSSITTNAAAAAAITNDYGDPLNSAIHSNGSVLDSQTANLYNTSAAAALGLGPSYPYAQTPVKSSFLALSKTQSVSSMSSVNRTRIPKTLSTFVRWKMKRMFYIDLQLCACAPLVLSCLRYFTYLLCHISLHF